VNAGPIDLVAEEFGITRRTLYRLISKHGLQTYRQVGDRRTYVDRDDVRPLLGLQPNPRKQARSRQAE
jgi:excisionase family DNA binding protein